MRQNVSAPYWSSISLNASIESGSSSEALRSIGLSSLGLIPLIAGISIGDGRKSTTASRSGCTPLFLKAEPQSTGTNMLSIVPRRIMRRSVSASGSLPSRYCSIASSSASTAASIIISRYSAALSARSAGMSTTSHDAPRSSPCQINAFISIRSTTPLSSASAPIGI